MSEPIRILYTDPPWWYSNRKTGGERKKPLVQVPGKDPKFGGGARKHYPLMRDRDLLALAPLVQGVMEDDSACLMWGTMPRLDFGIELLGAWGFRYVTAAFVWIKSTNDFTRPRYGPGTYTASNAEVVLLGVRGSMGPVKKMTGSVILTPRFEHSVKPSLHRVIDKMYPTGRRVEMFARRPHQRRFAEQPWEAIGNGVSGLDIKDELATMATEINGGRQLQLGGLR